MLAVRGGLAGWAEATSVLFQPQRDCEAWRRVGRRRRTTLVNGSQALISPERAASCPAMW